MTASKRKAKKLCVCGQHVNRHDVDGLKSVNCKRPFGRLTPRK